MGLERGFNGEAHWLLPETTVLIPVPTWELMTICKLQFQGSNTRFWSLWALHTYEIYLHTYRQIIFPHIKKLNLKKTRVIPMKRPPFS